MPNERRVKRLSETMKRVINQAILKEGNFPVSIFVTLTRVKLAANLEWADIYFSVYPTKSGKSILRFLSGIRVPLQSKINLALKARRTPKLRFHIDEGFAKGEALFTGQNE